MSFLNFIIWSPDPAIFHLPFSLVGSEDRPVVWYGLLFALGFIISQQVMYYIYRREGKDEKEVDTLTTYMVLATIIGARLGHCLFYNPKYYLSNPIEIIKIWEGGLASHGGAIGILFAIWLYANYDIRVKWWFVIPVSFSAKKIHREGQSYLWVLDRLAIVTLLTGALIRTGNLMNSEMEGLQTNSDYGLVYARGAKDILNYNSEIIDEVYFEKEGELSSSTPGIVPLTAIIKYNRDYSFGSLDQSFIASNIKSRLNSYREVKEHIDFGEINEPLRFSVEEKSGTTFVKIYGLGTVRHPAQLYEALACFLFMLVLFWIWNTKRETLKDGFLFGLFMSLLWSQRFFNEFFKMDQEPWEASIPLNMGQWLSIPFFLIGISVMIYSQRKGVRKS